MRTVLRTLTGAFLVNGKPEEYDALFHARDDPHRLAKAALLKAEAEGRPLPETPSASVPAAHPAPAESSSPRPPPRWRPDDSTPPSLEVRLAIQAHYKRLAGHGRAIADRQAGLAPAPQEGSDRDSSASGN